MKAVLILCALAALAQGASINNRIVGGSTAAPGQFKHMASLRSALSNFHFCGATVVDKHTLITAAHCKIYNVDNIVAVVGTTKLDDASAPRYKLKSFVIHEDYNSSKITNDIAVITLEEDIEFNNLVQPVHLASRPIKDGQRLTSSGWGYTSFPGESPNDLQYMNMNVVNSDKCKKQTGLDVTGKICTLESAGKGVCSGDSGGPLINADNELVGVTSAAYLCALGKPDFFTNVYYFLEWILAHSTI